MALTWCRRKSLWSKSRNFTRIVLDINSPVGRLQTTIFKQANIRYYSSKTTTTRQPNQRDYCIDLVRYWYNQKISPVKPMRYDRAGVTKRFFKSERKPGRQNLAGLSKLIYNQWSVLGTQFPSFRKHDYENYLSNLLLPGLSQRGAFAIRALNVELALIRDIVSEKNIGVMRLKFWQDNIDRIYQGSPPNTPVALELYGATQHLKLSKKWLANMVDARFEQMDDKSYTSIKHIEEFAEKGVCPINYLLLQCLGVENIHADHAASHIGKAQSIVTLLRAAPFHAGKKKVYLPMDLLIKNKVSQESVIRGKTDQPIKDVIYEIASIAHHHLKHARSFKSDVPKEACVAFLSTVSCEWYLKQLQIADFNIFDSRLQRRNNLLPLKLWLQKKKKIY
ncbi:hypothetical protein SNE40_007764 [Patella caerulea]|uniref:NADH dehydrogenase (ubiquinone) complex I, assembly factor 6 n=1 Tax=Patella caerulea TaxID=87958 RepID=A0AAN8K585_PATCE